VDTSDRTVLIVRHGDTPWSIQGRFAGHLDVLLSAAGLSQAAALGAALAPLHPAAVITSDLRRARETARQVADVTGAPVVTDARLREEFLGAWQGRTHAEIKAAHPQAYLRWQEGDVGAFDGREGLPAVAERATAAVQDGLRRTPAGPIVVVTHANTAIALLGRLLALPVSRWLALDGLAPAHRSVLEGDADRWRLRRHNVPPSIEKECVR
jgi:broad specificity phosphatase PhoE